MGARADGDLLAAPPEDLPPELTHLTQMWLRTLEAATFESDRIHDLIVPIVVVQSEDGAILSVNRAALRLFQYDNAGQLVYENIRRLVFPPEDIFNLTKETETKEVHGRRKDGSYFHLEIELLASSNSTERIVALRDVTARKAMEVAMDEARQAAIRTAKLQAHFLANMSHEIRTPVNGILGMASLLMDTELSDEQRQHLGAIQTSGNTLLTLINDILDLSKIESGKMELDLQPSDVREAVKEVMTLMAPRADDQGNALRADYAPQLPSAFKADGLRLKQVLTNLVGNAVKFTCNGHVTLHVRYTAGEGPRGTLEIRVEDTGIGIPQHKLQAIFDKFTQAESSTSRRFGGTGLGLAITMQVVKLMEGTLEVTSTEGQGSTFTVRLPLEPTVIESLKNDSESASAPKVDLSRLQVLVAEDNPINQVITRRTLEKLGITVTLVDNGADAHMATKAHTFDLVLMDCMMPGTDGYEGTRRIREDEQTANQPRMPIIALTAKAMKGDRDNCLRAGMDDYLTKPFTAAALRGVLERWCGEQRPTTTEGSQ